MYKAKVSDKEYEVSLDRMDQGKVTINGKEANIDLHELGEGTSFHVLKDTKGYQVEVVSLDMATKKVVVKVNGTVMEYEVKDKLDLLLSEMGLSSLADAKLTDVKAPMPGLVLDTLVKEGDTVNKGDGLLVLEAMKMENVIKSPTEGEVKSIEVNQGDAVEKNQVLIQFK